ncbi:ROK family protein [Brassicibacter mesophilus]|uniref:ROK family protein n=1 Tax=Brassicibacter mesophilus TaxID=745119 RepID=UPI003D1DDD1D
MRNIACFDVGGTFVKYGLLKENGNIIFKSKFPSPTENCKKNIPFKIVEQIERMSNKYSIDSVGISTTGKVDSKNGEIIFSSDNLPDYTGAKLSRDIEKLTGLDCSVENDVNAAALGESWKGAGKNVDTFVCITFGTGIGGAIIMDGELYKGIKNGAGEIGHMIINEGGERCSCGGSGCYERYASTAALVRQYESLAKLPRGSVNGKIIFDKVKNGDELALDIYNKFLSHIVTGLVNITHLLDPGLIVVGGGISEVGSPFFRRLNEMFAKKVMPSYGEHTEIVQADLGNDAGLVGACYIALSKLGCNKL